ncbi:hypothetical protein [Kitasatospora sp. NPDC097643]|uniref:hypothetical protein n=1 Tax=Kitasatospora sp. NPDC097643 TaxID=3157230 RepID=UPI003327AA7B
MENGVDFRHTAVLHGLDPRGTAPPDVDGPLLTVHRRTTTHFPGLGAVSLAQPVTPAGLGLMHLVADLPEPGSTLRVWVLPTPLAPWRTRVRFAATVSVGAPRGGSPLPESWPPSGSSGGPSSRPSGWARDAFTAAAARAASWVALRASVRIVKQDRPVLDHKRYLAQPRLVPGERTIGLFGHWARQFYPDADGPEAG